MMLLEFSVMIVKYGFEKTSYEYDPEQEECNIYIEIRSID